MDSRDSSSKIYPVRWWAFAVLCLVTTLEKPVHGAAPPPLMPVPASGNCSPSGDALVPLGASWKYFAGEGQPPAQWNQVGFDDTAWPSDGPAGAERRYFRYRFVVPDGTKYSRVKMRFHGESAVVFLDGSKVLSSGAAPSPEDEEQVFVETEITADLQAGPHVVGTELLDGPVPDGFLLELVGICDAPPKRELAAVAALPAPGDLEAVAMSASSVYLTWKSSEGPNGFVLERTGSNGISVPLEVSAGARDFVDTGLEPSSSYTYRVRALTGTEPSPFSNSVSVTTHAAEAAPVPSASVSHPTEH